MHIKSLAMLERAAPHEMFNVVRAAGEAHEGVA